MSDELRIGVVMSFEKGGAKARRAEHIEVDVTGDAFTHEIQSVGTTEETLGMGADIATIGYVLIKNMDATNYVEVGKTTGVYTIKLKAGEVALFRHDGATPTSVILVAKANTATCLVEYWIIEE